MRLNDLCEGVVQMRLRTWQELAAHSRQSDGTIVQFPDELPDGSACDFDALKDELCKLRAGALCSVDVWGMGGDGSFYFIEFKDQGRNTIAQLKKKAFDSLIIFWMTIGKHLSLDEIRSRSEFILVKPNAEEKSLESDKLAVMLNELVRVHVPRPIGFQLEEISKTRMYKKSRSMTTRQFIAFLKKTNLSYVPDDEEGAWELHESRMSGSGHTRERPCEEISLNRILVDARYTMNKGMIGEDFCDDDVRATDFKKEVEPFLSLRMMLPMEDSTARQRGALVPCDAYIATDKRLVAYHTWKSKYPVGYLANMMFDSFLLWAFVFHSDASADTVMRNISMCVVYDGDITNWVCASQKSFIIDFYNYYKTWFNRQDVDESGRQLRFGLRAFVENGFYKSMASIPSDQFADFVKAPITG